MQTALKKSNVKKISVLVDPIPHGRWFISEVIRKSARMLRDWLRPPRKFYLRSRYRGHFAVTRSLVEGLQKLGLPYNYDPRSVRELSDVVVVLAGVRTLQQAVELKRKGLIKTLAAGPNITTFSTAANSILAAPEVDIVINHCEFACDFWIFDNPSIKGRCFIWPAGVDTNYWKSDTGTVRDQILIYEKQNVGETTGLDKLCMEYLQDKGYKTTLLRYGTFDHDEYLRQLQQTRLMIGLTLSESQGIAWAEAWSTDVPTLLWRNEVNVTQGRKFKCNTAPYLHPSNGRFFDDLEDFKSKFLEWESDPGQFTPRDWVLVNMSDEVCAQMLYNKVTTNITEASS